MKLLSCVVLLLLPWLLQAQCVQGADLSYVNAIEANGGIYRDTSGERVDPYAYFAARGAEMVRIRLWHTPQNIEDSCGEPITSGSLEDVLLAARRTDSSGMALNLAIHYSDYFVDPGKQRRPRAWDGLSGQVLLDSIYDYTYRVLEALHAQGTDPAILAVGNETNNGFVDVREPTDGFDWAEDGPKFNAGLKAVSDFNQARGTTVKSAIHFTESFARFGAAELRRVGVTDYDVMALSYYPHFNPRTTIAEIGELVSHLAETYEKEVMVVKTGFSWNNFAGSDGYNNFLAGNGEVVDHPASPEGQLAFLEELTATVCENGGSGGLYWEPAWVTSGMCDAWGRGSSYENASFFDFDHRALPAFEFLDYDGTVSAEELPAEEQIRVYPNPYLGGDLRIEGARGLWGWKLSDATGREVADGVVQQRKGAAVVNPGSLARGVYFLTLTLEGGQSVTRRIEVEVR